MDPGKEGWNKAPPEPPAGAEPPLPGRLQELPGMSPERGGLSPPRAPAER